MRGKKRQPRAAEWHRRTGRMLAEMRARAQAIAVEVGEGGKTRPASRAACRVVAAFDALRARLDGEFARDHPDEFDTHTYYPGAPTTSSSPRA